MKEEPLWASSQMRPTRRHGQLSLPAIHARSLRRSTSALLGVAPNVERSLLAYIVCPSLTDRQYDAQTAFHVDAEDVRRVLSHLFNCHILRGPGMSRDYCRSWWLLRSLTTVSPSRITKLKHYDPGAALLTKFITTMHTACLQITNRRPRLRERCKNRSVPWNSNARKE